LSLYADDDIYVAYYVVSKSVLYVIHHITILKV